MGIAVRLLLLRYFAASRLSEAYKSSTAFANRAILIEHGARSMVTVRAARSSGSGLAVMQPINLGSGKDPILD